MLVSVGFVFTLSHTYFVMHKHKHTLAHKYTETLSQTLWQTHSRTLSHSRATRPSRGTGCEVTQQSLEDEGCCVPTSHSAACWPTTRQFTITPAGVRRSHGNNGWAQTAKACQREQRERRLDAHFEGEWGQKGSVQITQEKVQAKQRIPPTHKLYFPLHIHS